MPSGNSTAEGTPKFDFDPTEVLTDSDTATIKALLAEINVEDVERNAEGKEIGISNLSGALTFLGELTGDSCKSTVKPLPRTFLKTVKLLYKCSKENGDHIFQYLRLPDRDKNPATFEFRTSGNAARNETKIEITQALLAQLEKGLSRSKMFQIRTHLLTTSKLLDCISIENSEILEPIHAICQEYGIDDTLAVARLAEEIGSFDIPPTATPTPIHEALYTRISSLPFLHYVGEYEEIEALARLDFIPQSADEDLRALCRSMGGDIDPYETLNISISDYPAFFQAHRTALVKVVAKITRRNIQKRDLDSRIADVQKVLHFHLFQPHDRQPCGGGLLKAKRLALTDVVAAMCAVAHQKKVKTPYEAHWQGKDTYEGSKAIKVLNQLESTMSIEELYEEDYIPQGVGQLLLNRFSQFHAHMCGRHENYRAYRAFTLARLKGYAVCLTKTCIQDSVTAVQVFNEHCDMAAHRCAYEQHLAAIDGGASPRQPLTA